MFDELDKYKNNNHFFFQEGDDLLKVSKDVPNDPGVYIIYKLAKGKVELVYIGKSGTMNQNGSFKEQKLKKRINNKQEGIKRQDYFLQKIKKEGIDALDIYWYVTFNKDHQDTPAYVEANILQHYYDIYGALPPWNKEF